MENTKDPIMKQCSELTKQPPIRDYIDLDRLYRISCSTSIVYDGNIWNADGREFWKKRHQTILNAKLLTITNIADKIDDIGHDHLSLDATLNNWSHRFSKLDISFKASSLNTFDTKLILNQLPTIDIMKQRHGDKYHHMKCPSCKTHDESFNHLWTCPAYVDNRTWLLQDTAMTVLDEFRYDLLIPQHQLVNILDPLDIPQFLPDLARGFVIKPFQQVIEGLLVSKLLAKKVIKFISCQLRKNFRDMIWLPRCEAQSKQEKTFIITKKYKRTVFVNAYNKLRIIKLQKL